MRNIVITLIIIAFLFHCEADNQRHQRQDREIRNLRGVQHDQGETMKYLTHPKTMADRITRYYRDGQREATEYNP